MTATSGLCRDMRRGTAPAATILRAVACAWNSGLLLLLGGVLQVQLLGDRDVLSAPPLPVTLVHESRAIFICEPISQQHAAEHIRAAAEAINSVLIGGGPAHN